MVDVEVAAGDAVPVEVLVIALYRAHDYRGKKGGWSRKTLFS